MPLGKSSADLIQVLSVDQAAEDCHGDLDSGHDGICHAQYSHHVDDHEVLREEQDSYQSGPGIEGYNFHLIAGFRMVGFHPVGISHGRLGGVLGNFTGIVQGIEHTDCNNNEQYYSSFYKTGIHGDIHHQLCGGDPAGTHCKAGKGGKEGEGNRHDGVQAELFRHHHAQRNQSDHRVTAAEAAMDGDYHEHDGNQDRYALVLELVEGPVDHLIEGAGTHDDTHTAAADQQREMT